MIFFQLALLACFAFAVQHTIVPIAREYGRSPSRWTCVALGGWAAFLFSDFILMPAFIPDAPLALQAVSVLIPWVWLLAVKATIHILGRRDLMNYPSTSDLSLPQDPLRIS